MEKNVGKERESKWALPHRAVKSGSISFKTLINHPNKHLKSKSKAIKTLLTVSLLPQANHKRLEFTTFAGGREEDAGF